MHLNSELLFQKYAKASFKKGMKVLEIGPTGIPSVYSTLVGRSDVTWHTMDLSTTNSIGAEVASLTHVQTDEYHFPIKANSYDIVLAGQVLEHVREIWSWIPELKRVCKPGGKIILINPVSWPFHEMPVDCWRIYPEGIKALCDVNKLTIEICLWESLESDLLKDYRETPVVPGQSINYSRDMAHVIEVARWNKALWENPDFRKFVVPVEISYDTITICTK